MNEDVGVSQTLYRIMHVNFQGFGIFDRKQYFQGPKSKLLEKSMPTACHFQWNSWKLGTSIIQVKITSKLSLQQNALFLRKDQKIRKSILLML